MSQPGPTETPKKLTEEEVFRRVATLVEGIEKMPFAPQGYYEKDGYAEEVRVGEERLIQSIVELIMSNLMSEDRSNAPSVVRSVLTHFSQEGRSGRSFANLFLVSEVIGRMMQYHPPEGETLSNVDIYRTVENVHTRVRSQMGSNRM